MVWGLLCMLHAGILNSRRGPYVVCVPYVYCGSIRTWKGFIQDATQIHVCMCTYIHPQTGGCTCYCYGHSLLTAYLWGKYRRSAWSGVAEFENHTNGARILEEKPNRMDEVHGTKVSTSVCFAWTTSLYYMHTRHCGTHCFCFNLHPNFTEVLIHQFLTLQDRREESHLVPLTCTACSERRGGAITSTAHIRQWSTVRVLSILPNELVSVNRTGHIQTEST